MKITRVHAREILDSRGNPTLECDVHVGSALGRAGLLFGPNPSANLVGVPKGVLPKGAFLLFKSSQPSPRCFLKGGRTWQ